MWEILKIKHPLKIGVFLFVIGCVIVCFLPYLFTKCVISNYINCLSKFDLEFNATTGAIGDTIGGTMSPFIAIIATIVTFAAFWVQYKFNYIQRKDIEKERVVNNFYELLHLFREYASNLQIESRKQPHDQDKRKYVGYDSYHHLYGMFLIIHTTVKSILNRAEIKQEIDKLDKNEIELFIVNYSYSYFFYGERIDLQLKEHTKFHKIYNYIQKEIIKNEFAIDDARLADYCHNRDNLNQIEQTYKLYIDNSEDCESELHSDNYFLGFHNYLGGYFRRLYNLVCFIDNNAIFNDKEKEEYIKMIRSQLSDYEQLLLYYNSLSDIGEKWNTHLDGEIGLLAKYRLISNIPITAMVAPKPFDFFKEEIHQMKKNKIDFFENNLTDCNTKNGLEEFIKDK